MFKPGGIFIFCAAILFVAARPLQAEQLWLSQSVSVHASPSLRLILSNTSYLEHGHHFANEEASSFRMGISSNWSAGAGITWGQDKVDRHWERSSRPTEHVSFDWHDDFGRWSVFDAQRFDLKFREGERDWVVYRNIGSLTAPIVPGLPWNPRPYLTQQIYFSTRECFAGHDRFCQFRWGAGIRLLPLEHLYLSAYWQYRDIERTDGAWRQSRVAGLSASLVF